jgi:hemoglobin-like flavoprotein
LALAQRPLLAARLGEDVLQKDAAQEDHPSRGGYRRLGRLSFPRVDIMSGHHIGNEEMNERDNELFNDSYERCLTRSGFLERFYAIFVASSDEAAAKFAHTDLQKQIRMLKVSLYMLMNAAGTLPEGTAHLERIAELHSRKRLDIKPELYDLWLECLLKAASEFDPSFRDDIAAAWRNVLAHGIRVMKSRY